MATSGSTDFSVNRDELITLAMRNIGALETGESPTPEEYSDASQMLNMMLKTMQNDGLDLWLIKEAILIPEKGLERYTLGPTGDHCTYDVNKTEMRVAGIASDVTLEVDSTTGMTVADNIGILQDDGTIHWTTISSITDSDTVVVATGLVSASAIDNHIYYYTNKIDRPHHVNEVLRRDYDDRIDVPLIKMSRDEFNTLSDKDSSGTPVNYWYDPQLTNAKMNIWNVADSDFAKNDVLVLWVKKPFDDMDAGTNDFECPQEWYMPIMYDLSLLLAPMHFLPTKERYELKVLATKYRDMAESPEDASIFLQPG